MMEGLIITGGFIITAIIMYFVIVKIYDETETGAEEEDRTNTESSDTDLNIMKTPLFFKNHRGVSG